MSILLTNINTNIETLANAEKVVKATINVVCPDILEYLYTEQQDSQVINRLLAVCTPMNKRGLTLFFQAMTAFKYDESKQVFTGLNKKKLDEATAAAEAFKASGLTVWEWLGQNVRVDQKPVDYAAKITKDVTKALGDEEQGLTPAQVIKAVLAGGITADGLLDILGMMDEEDQVAEATAVEALSEAA